MILLQVKPLKELTFTSANITATMTSRQFQVMVDVLTNLLFARLPKYVHEFVSIAISFFGITMLLTVFCCLWVEFIFLLLSPFFFFLCVFFHFYSISILRIYILLARAC